jgi:two-component system NtrC family sensor kinase
MKLALRLAAAIMIALTCLLIVHTYVIVQREIGLFSNDMDRHAYLVGRTLAGVVPDMWQVGGTDRVRQVITDANGQEDPLTARWVLIDSAAPSESRPLLHPRDLTALVRGQEVLQHVHLSDDQPRIVAYFPLSLPGQRLSAIEISEPLAPMYWYTLNTLVRSLVLLLAVIVISGLTVWILGVRIVGRPVKEMVRLAENVGYGHFDRHINLATTHDEFADLGAGLNNMVDHLRESRERLSEQTQKQIETLEQLHHAERLTTAGKLASGLAHELGTPLNVVSGRAKLIASLTLDSSQVKESASIISDQADRMAGLIRQLLDFVRHPETLRQKVEPSQLMKHVLILLEPIAKQAKVTLDVRCDADNITVRADSGQLQQVASNLVMNAISAMPNGGKVEITITTERSQPPADLGGEEATYACLAVTDNGVGIPEENLKRIFMPFFTTMDVGKGTGLGLSIAHGIIRDHDGWIDVKSTIGEGSTFYIYLPLGDKQ